MQWQDLKSVVDKQMETSSKKRVAQIPPQRCETLIMLHRKQLLQVISVKDGL